MRSKSPNKAWIKAAKNNDLVAMKQAVENGADASTHGMKALRAAVKAGAYEATDDLINIGYNLNVVDFWDKTLLSYAIENDHAEIVRLLLSRGANANSHKDHMYKAVKSGNIKTVQYLIDAGTYLENTCNTYTPLQLALMLKKDPEIIKLLVQAGANLDANEGSHSLSSLVKKHPAMTMDSIVSFKAEIVTPTEARNDDKPAAPNAHAAPAADEVFEKLSDNQLLHTVTSKTGLELTAIFNFQIRDITRIQTKDGIKLSEEKTKFSDLDDVESIKPMFDKLVELGGRPSSKVFDAKRAVPLPKSNP